MDADWNTDDDNHEEGDSFIQLDNKVEGKRNSKVHKKKQSCSRVVYLGRIPHGFYEDQMRGFFTQFGTITRLRLSRNKKTGKSKHFAYIEFEEPVIAQIVADTMNSYRLFDHTLVCHVVPLERIHPELFSGANKKFRLVPHKKIAREQHNKARSFEEQERLVKRLLIKEELKRKRLKELNVSYDFKGYSACVQPTAKHTKF